MNPAQFILKFAAQVADVFLLLKVCEEPIEEKKPRLRTRHGTANTSQIVELSKSAGKGSFAALIRPGDDKDALWVLQIEVVRHDRRSFATELIRQSKVKHSTPVDLLGLIRDIGIAKGKAGLFEPMNVLKTCDVELHFTVEPGNFAVEIAAMTSAILLEGGEDVGIQLSDPIQYGRFNMIHVRRRTVLKAVLFGCTLAKLLECLQYICAVVRFRVVFADCNALARYMKRILNLS